MIVSVLVIDIFTVFITELNEFHQSAIAAVVRAFLFLCRCFLFFIRVFVTTPLPRHERAKSFVDLIFMEYT